MLAALEGVADQVRRPQMKLTIWPWFMSRPFWAAAWPVTSEHDAVDPLDPVSGPTRTPSAVSRRRARLARSMVALERYVASPAPGAGDQEVPATPRTRP